MSKNHRIFTSPPCVLFFVLILFLVTSALTKAMAEPRGEIRVTDSYRPDINVLGHNVLQYLYEYDLENNEMAPSLAVSRRWVNDTTLEIKLRQNVQFHNGEPFDADSVKFNFDFQRQHNPGRGIQVFMKNVRRIKIVDPYTIQMVLENPDALLLNRMESTGPTSGWVIGAPRYMQKVGWDEFLKYPVGTGPYIVQDVVKDPAQVSESEVHATLMANPAYWNRGYPKIRKITFIKHSPREALRAVIEGRVDLVTGLIPKDTLKVEESAHSKVVKGREDVTYTIGWLNLMSPHTFPLRDMRVRKALNYAVNKEELLRYAFKGNAVVMRGLLTEKSRVDISSTETYEWNIPKARQLLKEAGYAEGFKMRVLYHEKDYLLARLLERFYRLLKIEIEMIPADFESLVRHTVYPNTEDDYSWETEEWWIQIISTACHVPEAMGGFLEWCFHSKAAWRTTPDWLLLPLERIHQQLLKTKDHERRFQIYKEANEYIADQALWVFTVAPLGLYGVNEELNFIPQPSQCLYLDYSSVTENHWSLRGKNN